MTSIVVMKKKKLIYLTLITLTIGILYYCYHFLMDSKEPMLNTANYSFELDTIRQLKHQLKNKKYNKYRCKKIFVDAITQKVFPYWYGTSWDFNGTTETPQKGTIACGYFVTTTLRDMGVPLNRVKLAQCASEQMIRKLTTQKNIYHFSNMSLKQFEHNLVEKGDGLYIVGLDNHTGFIFMNGAQHYFIHSTGWFPFKVVKDVLKESKILANSKYRVVGKISDDDLFLKNWIGYN
jgi:hypothetical protein